MPGPHVVPPVDEGVVFAVIQLTYLITDTNRPFDAAGNDFLTNFVSQHLLAQVGHDRSIQNWSLTYDRSISAQSQSITRRPTLTGGS